VWVGGGGRVSANGKINNKNPKLRHRLYTVVALVMVVVVVVYERRRGWHGGL